VNVPTFAELIDALVGGVLIGGLFAITALGLSLVFGVMRLINLVHGEMIIGGAYIALELTRHSSVDPLVLMPVAAVGIAIIAMPIYRVALAPLSDQGAEPALLTTFGLSIIAQNLFVLIFSGDSQSLHAPYTTDSFDVLGVTIQVVYLIAFGAAIVLCGAVHLLLQRTAVGRRIRAASEDAEAAAVMGVDVQRIHTIVFGIAAACAAVGGVLVGLTVSFTPSTGLSYLLTGLVVVVLGGLGSVKGTLLGALLLGAIESVGASFFGDGYREFIGFVAFLIVLSVRPQGLFGRGEARA
jgi:branched-chain amino acid transport system permease protein